MNITLSYNPVDNIPNAVKSLKLRFSLRYRYAYIWSIGVGIGGIVILLIEANGDAVLGGLGVALLFLSFFYFVTIFKARKKSLLVASNVLGPGKGGPVTMSFTDAHFIYNDDRCRYELKWIFFSGYFIRDGFLFLMPTNNDVLNVYSITISMLEPAEFEELNRFLFDNVPLYKYKLKR